MARYASQGSAGTLYDGSGSHDPTIQEMIQGLYNFMGVKGGETFKPPGGPAVSKLYRMLFGNRLPTAEEQAAYLKASFDFGLGGFLEPNGWADYGLSVLDYSRALVGIETDGLVLHGGGSGGGGAYFGADAPDGVAIRSSQTPAQAADIWNMTGFYSWSPGGFQSQTAGNLLRQMANLINLDVLSRGVQLPDNEYFLVWADTAEVLGAKFGSVSAPPLYTEPDQLDFTTVTAGDTVLSFLTRTQPGFAWVRNPVLFGAYSGSVWALDPSGATSCWFICTLTDRELHLLQPQVRAYPAAWPGLAGVVLSTALTGIGTGSYTVTCDGVLVDLTSPPTKGGYQQAGDRTNWFHVGWIAFHDATGRVEALQFLGNDSVVYVPRTIITAAGFDLFVSPGAVLTVTPWVLA